MKVWLNGEIVDEFGAIDARDRGVLLGDGVFETIALLDGEPMLWDAHCARLRSGAESLGMPMTQNNDALEAAVQDIVSVKGITEGSARITLLRGIGPRGVLPPETQTPTLMISASAGCVGSKEEVHSIIASSTRRNAFSPLSSIKSTNYLDAIIARREAENAKADEAIMLNTEGVVAEATASNVFCLLDNELLTPKISDGALPGIMRACVIERCQAKEASITPDMLMHASEIFLTSSLSVRPVLKLDGMHVGSGAPGPVWSHVANFPRQMR